MYEFHKSLNQRYTIYHEKHLNNKEDFIIFHYKIFNSDFHKVSTLKGEINLPMTVLRNDKEMLCPYVICEIIKLFYTYIMCIWCTSIKKKCYMLCCKLITLTTYGHIYNSVLFSKISQNMKSRD